MSEEGRDEMSNNGGAAAGGGAIYGLGIFGAWVYFWQQADGFWEHILAILEGSSGRRSWCSRRSRLSTEL